MSDPIRELLAFMIARELHMLCRCGQPATTQAVDTNFAPVCDACAEDERFKSYMGPWREVPHAKAIRRLLGLDRCGWPFDGVECDLPKGHEESHSWTRADHRR